MNGFRRFTRQGFVVVFASGFWIKAEIKLVLPAELKTRFRQHIVAFLRPRMSLRQVSGVRSDLVSDDTLLHIVPVRQSEMFLRGHIAEHGASEPANHRRTDTACDMVIAGSDVGCQRTQGIKRCFITMFELQIHVLFNQVHRDMSGSLNHDLAVVFPSDLRQFAECL